MPLMFAVRRMIGVRRQEEQLCTGTQHTPVVYTGAYAQDETMLRKPLRSAAWQVLSASS